KPDLPLPKTAKDAGRLWEALGEAGPAAEPAVWALVRAPEVALALLKKRCQPVKGPGAVRLRALIAQLDSDEFASRPAASRELAKLGAAALEEMKEAVRKPASLEQGIRLKRLIAAVGPESVDSPPASLRDLRALEVLERIGSAEAKRLVKALADGDASAFLT